MSINLTNQSTEKDDPTSNPTDDKFLLFFHPKKLDLDSFCGVRNTFRDQNIIWYTSFYCNFKFLHGD